MGVDCCVVSGIGRIITTGELDRLFNLNENDENYDEIFEEKQEEFDKYSDNLFYITNDGGIGDINDYYILLNDLLKDGISGIQNRIEQFIKFLEQNGISADIEEISIGYFG